MTVTVGSAAPGGSDVLMQTVSGKAAVGHRGFSRRSEEATAQSDEATSENSAPDELDASQTRVDKPRKTTKRDDKTDSDDDKSFENTFDAIGQSQSKDSNAASVKSEAVPLSFVIAHAVQGDALPKNSDTTATPSDTQQGGIRSTARLQQKSILAFMDAKDRLANTGEVKSQDAIDADTAGQSNAGSQVEKDVVPMNVDRQETHWNFISDALSNATSQVSALQSDVRKMSAPLSKDAATVKASKEQTTEVDSKNTASGEATNISVATSDPEGEAPSFSNNGGNGGAGAQPQTQTVSTTSNPRKIADTDSTPSLDQITTTVTPQPGATNVTTQVKNSVLDSLSTGNANTSTNVSMPDGSGRPTSAPVMKTLDLTLSPPDLGSVKLRLSLKSNSLTIEAEASKASTAKLLTDDRQNLERGLKDAGYDVASMKITDTSASSSSNGGGWQSSGSPNRDGDQSRSSFSGRQDGEMQRRDGSPSEQSQRRAKETNPQTTADAGNGKRGNAVYI